MKLQTKLKNWGGIIVDCVTDEDAGDIDLAIFYHDHGDEFLYVRTYSKEQYEYGYYLNRKDCWANFDPKLNGKEDAKNGFIIRPLLYKMPDTNASMNNEVFRILHNDNIGIQKWMDFGPQKYNDADSRLRCIFSRLKHTIDIHPDTMYDFRRYRDNIMTFIEMNDLGDEYIQMVDSITWTSRINGIDGVSGKKEGRNVLYGDGIYEVLYRGKTFDLEKLSISRLDYDEYGEYRFRLNTKQFA